MSQSSTRSQKPRPAALARWLWLVALLVVSIVVVGGITRLTESGLSITEWKPVTGIIPPLGEAQWAAEFAHYKHSSQYVLMNEGMTLAAFKHIYFWEYFHRLIGRLIGFAFALPLIWFWLTRAIPRGFGARLVVLFLLGGAQGAVGWLMVRSGLTDRVNVEPAMLAAHLSMALVLLSAIVWTACDLRHLAREPASGKARLGWGGVLVFAILFVQIFFGAITAGLRAGQVASTWPLMNGHFLPEGIAWHGSFWLTLTSDPFLIHFLHRWWSWAAAITLLLLARALARRGARIEPALLILVVVTQMSLGILTVVTGVVLWVAVLHQVTGAVLVAVTSASLHRLGRRAQ